jgi:3-hydroxymyristoyl/3-hydroxydecanoyl-(acyl carrier protein) dehydratase
MKWQATLGAGGFSLGQFGAGGEFPLLLLPRHTHLPRNSGQTAMDNQTIPYRHPSCDAHLAGYPIFPVCHSNEMSIEGQREQHQWTRWG